MCKGTDKRAKYKINNIYFYLLSSLREQRPLVPSESTLNEVKGTDKGAKYKINFDFLRKRTP